MAKRFARIAIVLTLFVVVFGIFGLAIYGSSSYQKCSAEAGNEGSADYQGQEKDLPHTFVRFLDRGQIVFRCAEQSIAENNAVVSAVATVVIAVFTTILGLFTMSLARSTRLAAEAASDSASAFIESERGRMFVSEIKLIKKDGSDPQPTIDYSFVNVGRGAVIVIQGSIECELIDSIPRDITFNPTKVYGANNVVGPGAFFGIHTTPGFSPPCPPFRTPLTADDYANITAKKAWILVKGFIRYRTGFDDVYRRNFGGVHVAHGNYFSDVRNEEYREQKPK